MEENKRVLLGMSGGVDSSVSAILLKEQGYEVIGINMQLCDSNKDSSKDAKKVCDILDIPYYELDAKKEFKNKVMDYFSKEYAICRTPNPCIECNRYFKFGLMYEKAKELNCNYIATGHYAKIEYDERYKTKVLKKSNSIKKDQSYVLYSIDKEILNHILFPLADFENKEQIREIARKNNLPVSNKPDSEDICFIPDGNYKKFLEDNSNIRPKVGNIVNRQGEVLGKHTGLYNYTIGQRKGLGISYKEPLFVNGFNKDRNEVIVGVEAELYRREMKVDDINLLLVDKLEKPLDVKVKIRYSSKEAEAIINQVDNYIQVIFKEPQRGITKGQSAVFYIDDVVFGGGKIID